MSRRVRSPGRRKRHRSIRKPTPANIAADPIGAVLILPAPATEGAAAFAGLLIKADGSADIMQAIPQIDGRWALSEPTQHLTPDQAAAAICNPAPLITPIDIRAALKSMAAIRRETEREVERLIEVLDRLDCNITDREPDTDDEDDADAEPSLGFLERHPNPYPSSSSGDQTEWAAGSTTDQEDEHDGREPDIDNEPDVDDEPSLGSPGGSIHDQTLWSHGTDRDHELDAGDVCEVEVE